MSYDWMNALGAVMQQFEHNVQELDRIATKQASAAESMCEAANSISRSVEEFGYQVANYESAVNKSRQPKPYS
jgi:ABC-type transporter Mla subunit MlaD